MMVLKNRLRRVNVFGDRLMYDVACCGSAHLRGKGFFNIILDDDRDPRDMQTKIIGIDCATHPSRVGVALGLVNQQTAKLLQVEVGGRDSSTSSSDRKVGVRHVVP